MHPGKVYAAEVIDVIKTTSQSQIPPSGILPPAPTTQMMPETRGVALKLVGDLSNIPIDNTGTGGALGTATIYTEAAGLSHVIRKVMMRMEAWMNYIKPY